MRTVYSDAVNGNKRGGGLTVGLSKGGDVDVSCDEDLCCFIHFADIERVMVEMPREPSEEGTGPRVG